MDVSVFYMLVRPISTSNAANIKKEKGLIDENCRLSCYELESIIRNPESNCPWHPG